MKLTSERNNVGIYETLLHCSTETLFNQREEKDFHLHRYLVIRLQSPEEATVQRLLQKQWLTSPVVYKHLISAVHL